MTGGARWFAATLALLLAAVPASAQTRAGTAITNVATAYRDGVSIPSNSVALTVAERLDVALVRSPDADTVLASGTRAIAVTLVNRGNGDEAFVVVASVDTGSATIGAPLIATPAGSPVPLVDGRAPVLAPGAALVLLVPVPSAVAGAVLAVEAHAATGSGTSGTIFAGAGDGGGDAVVGPTGAAARLTVPLAGDAAPTLDKSQAVRAPDGSTRAVRGGSITYTLVARFAAASADAEIVDPIPPGTTYAPGSLSLDGAPVADAGHVAAGQVSVRLGAVPAGAARTLRFTVVIS